ncbi:insulin-degrading-like enzyme, metalloprotease family M16A [Achlya hypogyna]|uniref:Insulin-degrading-like enzyme, metalloprotease family M16A n=1 Tax=Achlya hypogyna TaxID=1202772 RepID=A0A1V9YL43_ACHHY|nr:insulin-degrading-like enzyme, metalloprotease family M16A [Achlya hypogyna]
MQKVRGIWGTGSKWVGGLEVSRQDLRLYRAITLPNKLTVLLVSDEAAEKAAASLAVGVGHQSDPPNVPGLAHFLEHMLFLGTTKYPDETAYKSYLSAHGGRSNASTSAIGTNYYFDVAPPHLFGALDRFAQFFISPLFTPSATEREMHAVDAENAKNLMDDGRRFYQLSKSLANPAHPFHKFGTGNLTTLRNTPAALGIDVRAELLAFHARHYSANAMKLVIYGKDDLDTLEEWATALFSPIANAPAAADAPPPALPYDEAHLGRFVQVVPVRDLRSLELTFPLPSMQPHFLDKPHRVLSHLLGHEGRGSLCAHLRALGLANGVSTGLTRDYGDWSQFSVKIALTAAGLDAVPAVATACFQYVRLLANADDATLQRVFDETQTLSALQLRFRNQEKPIAYVAYLARNLQLFPLERAVSGPYVLDNFHSQRFRDIVALLTPRRLRLYLTSQRVVPDSVEPWLGAAYADSPLDQLWLQQWEAVPPTPALHLPPPNPFLPSALDLMAGRGAMALVREGGGLRGWHWEGNPFGQPKASARFKWYAAAAYATPEASVLTELYTLWLDDVLAESLYDAQVAGTKIHASNTTAGVTLHVAGYDESLPRVVAAVLALQQQPMDPAVLARLRDALERDLANTLLEEPHRWAVYQRQLALTHGKWAVHDKLAALQAIADLPAALSAHAAALFASPKVEAFVYGNMAQVSQAQVDDLLATVAPDAPGAFAHDVPEPRNYALSGEAVLQVHAPNTGNGNGAVHLAFECGGDAPADRAAAALLAQVLKVPCFTTLRTREQLGYIVSSSAGSNHGAMYVYVTVQSNVASPAAVQTRIELFLESFQATLATMADADFEKHKDALVGNLLEKPKTYEEASARLWEEIAAQTYDFERREAVAAAVRVLDKADVEALLARGLVDKATRKLFATQVWPATSTIERAANAIDSIEAFQKDRPLCPPRAKVAMLPAKL